MRSKFFFDKKEIPSESGGIEAYTVLYSNFWNVRHVRSGLDLARGFTRTEGALCFLRSIDSQVKWDESRDDIVKNLPLLYKRVQELEYHVKGIEWCEDIAEGYFAFPGFVTACICIGHVKLSDWHPEVKWYWRKND